jgi:hypothetical protein
MNNVNEQKEIHEISCQKCVDNSELILKGFWEQKQHDQVPVEYDDAIKTIISIVEGATESIYIYSPNITHTDLRLALEKKRTDGIRIYAITSSIKIHSENDLFSGIGVMREMKDISSTFVISDPKGSNSQSVWYVGDLTSKQEPVQFFLMLNKDQVKETWAFFSYNFWKADGEELYFNKIRETKKLKPATPEVKEVLPNSFRVSGIESVFGSDQVYEMWLSPNMPQELMVYCSYTEKCVLQLHENSKEIIGYIEGNDCRICGTKLLPFCFVHVGKKEMVMSSDIGFILTDEQKNNLHTVFQTWEWQYNIERSIQDINNPIVLSESDWTMQEECVVQEVQEIELETVIAPSIEEWQNEMPESVIPDSKLLAKKICYKWILEPPTLPEDAIKHKLYEQWDRFSEKFSVELSDLKKGIDTFRSDMGENKDVSKIVVNQQLSSIEDKCLKIENNIGSTIDTVTAHDMAEKFMSIKQDFVDLENYNIGTQEREVNELEIQNMKKPLSKKKQRKQEKKKRKNELEVAQKPDASKIVVLSELVPRRAIPPIGTLYEKGNTSYLTIQFVDQIDEGNIIAKQYHAILVAERR